jgi:replicative DNA helicase
MAQDAIPPHDVEAEAALVGAVLIGGREVLDELPADLSPKDFYSGAHSRVFEAVREVADAGEPIDLVTVGARLRVTQRLQQAGGPAALADIANSTPALAAASVQAYARTVKSLAQLRRACAFMQRAVAEIYRGVPDTRGFFEKLERGVLEISTSSVAGGFRPMRDVLTSTIRQWQEQQAKLAEGGISGVSYGFDRLDRVTGGMGEGDLVIVAGRPGMGKTAAMMAMASAVAKMPCLRAADDPESASFDNGVAVFSLEMPGEQLGGRLLCAEAGANLTRTRTGGLSPAELGKIAQTLRTMREYPIEIDDTGRPSIDELRSKARRKAAEFRAEGRRLRLIIVDYLQLIRLNKAERHDIAIGEVTSGLKALAKELKCAIVCLSQLNRGLENRDDKRPRMADLKDSGCIEQDADVILFLYRDEYYNRNSQDAGRAEIIIGKQRNGATGMVKVKFDAESTAFLNLPESEYEGEHG